MLSQLWQVFPGPPHLGITCAVMFVAELIYVLFGFGAGLIAVGSLAMVLPDIHDVVVLLLLVNLPAELAIVYRSREVISWRAVALVCVGIAVGVPAGTVALRWGDATIVLTLLGIFLVLAGAVLLFGGRDREPIRWPAPVSLVVGVISGVLSGLFGTGGPPLILYYRLAGLGKEAFRGYLMAIFLVVSIVRMPAYSVAGLLTIERLIAAAVVLPAVLLGALVGHRIHLQLAEQTFQRLVAAALALLGLLLLCRM